MSQYRLTALALADLDDIWSYLATNNPKRADQFLDRIYDKIRLLAEHPLLGSIRDDLAPNLRCLAVGKYVIFYRPMPDVIEILRVLHSARNIGRSYF